MMTLSSPSLTREASDAGLAVLGTQISQSVVKILHLPAAERMNSGMKDFAAVVGEAKQRTWRSNRGSGHRTL